MRKLDERSLGRPTQLLVWNDGGQHIRGLARDVSEYQVLATRDDLEHYEGGVLSRLDPKLSDCGGAAHRLRRGGWGRAKRGGLEQPV